MRVTQEADYGIRFCLILDEAKTKLEAEVIAQRACVTKSMALKVLRKLKSQGIVKSQKGAVGGYYLSRPSEKITVLEVIEAIDGAVGISKCLCEEYVCSRNGTEKTLCKMHVAFDAINKLLIDKLQAVTLNYITDTSLSAQDIVKIINT